MFGRKSKEKKEAQGKAQLELAKAMNRLADGIGKVFDPIYIQKTIGDALQLMAQVESAAPVVARALPHGVTLDAITIRLSDDERDKMAKKIYEVLQPQMREFDNFVRDGLKELPPHRLKQLADQIEKGAKPKLERRHGCVYVAMDTGYEAYLGL